MTNSTAHTAKPNAPHRKFRIDIERAGLPIFLVILIATFAVLPSTGQSFRTLLNIKNVLAYQSVTGLIALAMVIPLIAGYFDLSVAAIAGLSNVTVATLMSEYGQSVAVSLAAGVAVGALAGALNAFLVSVLNLAAYITTLGTYIFWAGALA